METLEIARQKLIESLHAVRTKVNLSIISDIINKIENDEGKHYVSFSIEENGKVAYARTEADRFNPDKRIRTTFERYVRRQLQINDTLLRDSDLSVLGRHLRIMSVPIEEIEKNLQFLSGNDIVEFYSKGAAGSCMTGGNSDKVSIYAKNPDKVKLVTMSSKLRALLWTTDEGVKVLDRAYPAGCDALHTVRAWAENKGYVLRSNPDQMIDGSYIELSDGNVYNITLKHTNVFPYFDTFAFGSLDKDKIIISNKKVNETNIVFRSTEGGYIGGRMCYECNTNIDDNDDYYSYNNRTFCHDCFFDNYCICHHCDDTYRQSEAREVRGEFYCNSCYDDMFCECEECNRDINKDDAVDYNDEFYCQRCIDRYFISCSDCDELLKESDAFEINGNSVCENCYNDYKKCFYCGEKSHVDDIGRVGRKDCCDDCQDKLDKCKECKKYFFKDNLMVASDEFICLSCVKDANTLIILPNKCNCCDRSDSNCFSCPKQ